MKTAVIGGGISGVIAAWELAHRSWRIDRVVNVAGPWVSEVLSGSKVLSCYRLDLVRGGHALFSGGIDCGCVLQVPSERRILFTDSRCAADIVDAFAKVGAITASSDKGSAICRDPVIEGLQRHVNVFGGKWAASRSLAIAAADITLH